MPNLLYDEDVPEVRKPPLPPDSSNVKDMQLFCGQMAIELDRLEEQLELYKEMLNVRGPLF